MLLVVPLFMIATQGGHPWRQPDELMPQQRPIDFALYQAVQGHDLGKVLKLLAKGANANGNVANGYRPLLAVDVNDASCIPIASALLKAGAHVNYVQPDQMFTPLTSFGMRDKGYLQFLLNHGADPNLIGAGGKTPLESAVSADNLQAVQALIAAKANVSKRSIEPTDRIIPDPHFAQPNYRESGETPLFGLAGRWSTPIYELLVQKGADPHAEDDNGWTLLDACVMYGNLPGVSSLLQAGFDPNHRSKEGFTSLHLAANAMGFPKPEIVAKLIRHGANPQLKTRQDHSAEELLRSRTLDYLKAMRMATLDAAGQGYLDNANRVLRELNPQARAIGNPKFDTSQWVAIGETGGRYRIVRSADKTQLVVQIGPVAKASTLNLSGLFLDSYESTLPGPFSYKIPAQQKFETAIDFAPGAGEAGSLNYTYSDGNGEGSFEDPGHLEPDLGWTFMNLDLPGGQRLEGPGAFFTNESPDRSVEVEVLSMGASYKGVLPVSFALAPHGHKLVKDSGKPHLVKYRSRLLPNRRWIVRSVDLAE